MYNLSLSEKRNTSDRWGYYSNRRFVKKKKKNKIQSRWTTLQITEDMSFLVRAKSESYFASPVWD